MKIIIPLAGPDYFSNEYFPKGLQVIEGFSDPYLCSVLRSRPWKSFIRNQDYIFLLKDSIHARSFSQFHIKQWFPESQVVFLSDYTVGPALTVAQCVQDIPIKADSLLIDLADIYFYGQQQNPNCLGNILNCKSVSYAFNSQDSIYSYFKLSTVDTDTIVECQEKKVISRHASCGVYWFESIYLYLEAVRRLLLKKSDKFFLSNVINELAQSGTICKVSFVDAVHDPKATN